MLVFFYIVYHFFLSSLFDFMYTKENKNQNVYFIKAFFCKYNYKIAAQVKNLIIVLDYFFPQ